MTTKREVEERLGRCKVEVEACRMKIQELEASVEDAKAKQLSPEAARAILGEQDDLVISLLEKAAKLADGDRIRFQVRGIIAHMTGKTLPEFLKSE